MSKRTNKDRQENIHILPLRSKKGTKRTRIHLEEPQSANTNFVLPEESSFEESVDFSTLAQKLEDRIDRIESDLKESIQFLEAHFHRALHDSKLASDEKNVKAELDLLTKQLEARVQKTLSLLSIREKSTGQDTAPLDSIKRMSSQLIKVLSFDFYKNVVERLGSADYAEEVDPFGMDRHLIQKIKPLFDFMYYKYWRVTTTGIENIPNEGRGLIVANHSGTVPYDGAMIKVAVLNEHPVRKDTRFLVENFVYHMPMLGTFMYRLGAVRACPENAELLLNAEHLVIVFPEGVKGIGKYYKQRYKLQRFGRGGFIKLCMKTNSPLIPVGVVGAEEIHPIIFKSNIVAKTIGVPYIPITPTFPLLGLLGCIPLPTKWSIHFGKPMTFDSHGPDAIDDDLLIHKLSEKVRAEIQDIIISLLRKRRSVWVG